MRRLGDVNGDGKIDLIDLALIKKSILGQVTLEGGDFKAADVNKSGDITISDLIKVRNHILGEDIISEVF